MSNAQYVDVKKLKILLGINDNIPNYRIRQLCSMCDIKFLCGKNTFVKKSDEETEINDLKQQFDYQSNFIVAYENNNICHKLYSYYKVFVIESYNILDIKKIFKIEKLKVFL